MAKNGITKTRKGGTAHHAPVLPKTRLTRCEKEATLRTPHLPIPGDDLSSEWKFDGMPMVVALDNCPHAYVSMRLRVDPVAGTVSSLELRPSSEVDGSWDRVDVLTRSDVAPG